MQGLSLSLQLNSARLEKVDVKALTSCGLLGVGLHTAYHVKNWHSIY
jgi:hypothetical protein